jgi:hypothetical protein
MVFYPRLLHSMAVLGVPEAKQRSYALSPLHSGGKKQVTSDPRGWEIDFTA